MDLCREITHQLASALHLPHKIDLDHEFQASTRGVFLLGENSILCLYEIPAQHGIFALLPRYLWEASEANSLEHPVSLSNANSGGLGVAAACEEVATIFTLRLPESFSKPARGRHLLLGAGWGRNN